MPAPATLYGRTERGAHELRHPAADLSRIARLIVVMADGTVTLADIAARLPVLDGARVEHEAQRLLEAGLIEALTSPIPAPLPPVEARARDAVTEADDRLIWYVEKADAHLHPDARPVSPALSQRRRPERGAFGHLALRLLVGVLGLGVLAAVVLAVQQELGPTRVAARLTHALGAPVTVGGVSLRLLPRPGLAYRDVQLPTGIRIPEVVLALAMPRAADRQPPGAASSWAEVVVPELELSSAQGRVLLLAGDRLLDALPAGSGRVRIDRLRLADAPLLAERYRLLLHRASDGSGHAELRELCSAGEWVLDFVVPADLHGDGRVEFRLHAAPWQPGWRAAQQELALMARGWVGPTALMVESFIVEGFGGVATGSAAFAQDVEWVGTAALRAARIDLQLLIGAFALQPPGSVGAPTSPLSGIAEFDLVASGRGASFAKMLSEFRAVGTGKAVRANLSGINLGLAAVQGAEPGAGPRGGGLTRFSELDAGIDWSVDGVRLTGLRGRSGAMTVRGELAAGPALELTGRLRVELGGSAVQAPLGLGVRGSVFMPVFVN